KHFSGRADLLSPLRQCERAGNAGRRSVQPAAGPPYAITRSGAPPCTARTAMVGPGYFTGRQGHEETTRPCIRREEIKADARRRTEDASDRGRAGGSVSLEWAGLGSHRGAGRKSAVGESELHAHVSRHSIR